MTVSISIFVAALLVAILILVHRATAVRTKQAWEELAKLVDGNFVPAGGPWGQPTPPVVECTVQGLDVVVDSYLASIGRASLVYTRAQVQVPLLADRMVKISHEGLIASVGKLFGTQDVQVGEGRYDDEFIIKACDPEWLQERLDEAFRERHLQRPEVFIVLEDGRLSAAKLGIEYDPKRLREQVDLVVACSQALAGAAPAG